MTLTFNCSLKLILFHTRNCVDATMCSSPALLTLAKALLGRNAFMLHSEANDEHGYNMRQSGVNWTDRFCFLFFFSFAANQQTRRCRRIQMSDEVMSLSLCSDSAALSFEYVSSLLLWCFRIFLFWCFSFLVFKAFMCCNFPVCPSVPETLNLWGHIRSQVRSSGTGLHSVSTSPKKEHFPKRWPHSKRLTSQNHVGRTGLLWCCPDDVKLFETCQVTDLPLFGVFGVFDRDWSGETRTRRPLLLLQRRASQGADPVGWLCVRTLDGGH